MKRRLLFLFADTGGGHRASAMAVAHSFQAGYSTQFDAVLLDPFRESHGLVAEAAKLYGPLTRNLPWLWGGLYRATNFAFTSRALGSTVHGSARRFLLDELLREPPAAIVSFHPLLNRLAVAAVRELPEPHLPVVTVVTDLVAVHASWVCASAAAILTPTEAAHERCLTLGARPGQVTTVGLPVHAAFCATHLGPAPRTLTNPARADLRRRLGLDPTKFCVLLCGGADGSGRLAAIARAVAAAGLDLELVVLCGRNHRAQSELRGLRHARGPAVKVHGFVDNMADFMHAADVVVTKAGPATIAEALCCRLPILLTWYLPGQESPNVDWAVGTGAARYLPRIGQMVESLRELVVPGSRHLEGMRLAAARAARPAAARDTARIIASMARQVEEAAA